MACGAPVIAFNTGRVPDMVRHMKTGYLATYKDVDDLAHGIRLLLEDDDLRLRLSRHCREVAKQEYPLELQTLGYAELYEALIAEKKR